MASDVTSKVLSLVSRMLATYLTGYEVRTAAQRGWSELENNDLMRAGDEAGFAVMITCVQNIVYQQNMRTRPIGLVVLSTNHWETLRASAAVMLAAVGRLEPKAYAYIECGLMPKRRSSPKLLSD